MLRIEINKKCEIKTNKSVKLKYKLGFYLQNSLITDTFWIHKPRVYARRFNRIL